MSRPHSAPTKRTAARGSCRGSARCTSRDAVVSASSSTPITDPSLTPSTEYQPGKHLSRVHEAGSRTGSIRVAVEKLDAPPEQRPRLPVRDRGKLRLGARNVEPAQRHDDDVRSERDELVPGTWSRWLAGCATDVLAPRERHQLGNPVARHVGGIDPLQHEYPGFP